MLILVRSLGDCYKQKKKQEINLLFLFSSKSLILLLFFLFNYTGSRGAVRYSIYSGDPNGFFSIDPVTGNIRVANLLDHETKSQVLLNIQATSGDPPSYGHAQVIYFVHFLPSSSVL